MISLIVLAAIAHLAMFLFHLKERQIFCCFWLVLGLYLFSIALQFENFMTEFGHTVLAEGLSFYFIGSIALFVCYELWRRFLPRMSIGKPRLDSLKKKINLFREKCENVSDSNLSTSTYVVLLFFSGLAFVVIAGSELNLNWSERRQFGSFGQLPFKIFTSLALVSLAVSVWFFKQKNYLLFVVTIVLGLGAVNLSGSRVIVLAMWGPALFSVVLSQKKLVQKIFLIGLIAIGSVTTHVASRTLRQISPFQSSNLDMTLNQNVSRLGGELGVARYYFVFLFNQNELGDHYFKYDTLKRVALFYLPRVGDLKKIKPEDVTNRMWRDAVKLKVFDQPEIYTEMMKAGYQGSVHATFWGDVYLNGRYVAMAIYVLLFSAIFSGLQAIVSGLKGFPFFIFSALTFASMAAIGRGSVFTGLSYILWVLPLILVFINLPILVMKASRRVKGE